MKTTSALTENEAIKPVVSRTLRYRVSEIFGPVCQGEGALTGRPTIFVRFGGCDYRCVWCDSLYAVLPEYREEWEPLTTEDIVARVRNLLPPGTKRGHITLSGGNPALPILAPLVRELHYAGLTIAIETQGTLAPSWITEIDDITLSPKPPSSGNVTAFDPDSPLAKIIAARPDSVLKVVVFTEDDYAYARDVHRAFPDTPFWLQAGTLVNIATRDDLCDALTDWQDVVLADPDMQDVHVGAQMHAILKGHQRGI